MPDLSAQLTRFRTDGYSYTGYLGFVPQTVVFSRAVNQTSFPDQLTSLVFDDAYTGIGAYSDVKEGQSILLYDGNTTRLKGLLRVAAGASTATRIQVNEVSPGWIDIQDNDKFTAVDSYSIWDILIEAAAAFRKDSRITFSDQTDNYKPVANGGGGWFGKVDAGQTYATILFDWTSSFPVDPDNSGGLTYLVAVGDGTITVGSSTSSTCTATFPGGFRHITLTVTDADNGASTVKRIPIYVYNMTTYSPLHVALMSLRYDEETGWSAEFSLPAGSEDALASLPDGSEIWYFEDEYAAGTVASYGSNAPAAGRSHIKFVGYLVRDTITIEPDTNTVVFEATSPLGILEKTAALPQLMIRDSSPDNWNDLKGLTVNLALWYMLYWHASVMTAFDFLWPDGTDLAYSILAIDDVSNMAEQLRSLAASIQVKVTCDRLGRILLIRDPNYMSLSDRSGRTTSLNLTTADLRKIEMANEHRRSVKLVVGEGIKAGTTEASQIDLYSLAPGKAPGQGTQTETLSKLIVADQTEINRITGEHYAHVNGTYWNETTHQIGMVPQNARWQVRGSYDVIDPAYLEFVTLTLATSTNRRGASFTTSTRWLVRSISIDYDPDLGSKEIEWVVDHETHGRPGVTDTRPDETDNPLPADLPPFDNTYPDFGIIIPTYNPNPALIPSDSVPLKILASTYDTTADIARATEIDLVSGILNWESIGGSGAGVSGTVAWMVADPWNYGRMFALTDSGLYKTDDAWGVVVVWSLVANNTDMFGNSGRIGHHFQMSINRRGYIIVLSGPKGGAVTFDYGATWATFNLAQGDGGAVEWGTAVYDNQQGSVWVSPWNSGATGWVYGVYRLPSGVRQIQIVKSTDWGLTWSAAIKEIGFGFGNDRGAFIHGGYKKRDGTDNANTGSQELYLIEQVFGGSLYFSNNGGPNFASTGPVAGSGAPAKQPVNTATLDGSNLFFFEIASGAAHLYHSSDGGVTNADTAPGYSFGVNNPPTLPVGVNGWPSNPNIAVAFGPNSGGYGIWFVNTASSVWIAFDTANWPFTSHSISNAQFSLVDQIPPPT